MELLEKYIVLQLELKDKYQALDPSFDNLKDLSNALDDVCDLYSLDLEIHSLEAEKENPETPASRKEEINSELDMKHDSYDALKADIKDKYGEDFFDKFDAVDSDIDTSSDTLDAKEEIESEEALEKEAGIEDYDNDDAE